MCKVLNTLRTALLEKGFEIREYDDAMMVYSKKTNIPFLFNHHIVNTVDEIRVFSYYVEKFVTIDEAIELLTH